MNQPVRIKIVKIGSSRGIRIPKALLEQAGFENEVEMTLESDSEIQKTRPCLIISPDEMNRHIATVIIAPMTTNGRDYPTRVKLQFQGRDGQVVFDQIHTVDKARLVKKLGEISAGTQREVLGGLWKLFAE